MLTTMVTASEIARHGRMDAEFHIAARSVETRAAELERTTTADEIATRLEGVDPAALEALRPLGRGSRAFDRAAAKRAIAEYPFIAMALVERDLAAVIERRDREIAQATDGVDRLRTLLP